MRSALGEPPLSGLSRSAEPTAADARTATSGGEQREPEGAAAADGGGGAQGAAILFRDRS